jgi:iron complex outermembrane receptor protein
VLLAVALACATSPQLQAQEARDGLTTISLDSLLRVPVASAARYSQTLQDAPASVTIVTGEQIERFGYRTLEEVLQAVRGFYSSYDRNYSYIGVRGFSRPTDYNNRIVLLLNGHVLNESVYNLVAAGAELGLDLAAVDRIEVVRGPGSALYGTGAMFAVINIITKRGRDLGSGKLGLFTGTGGRRELSALAGDAVGGADVLVSARWSETDGSDLYYAEFDDPLTNGGVAEGRDWERFREAVAVVSVDGLTVQARANRRWKGIPTGAWGVEFNDEASRTLDQWASLSVLWERALPPSWSLQARVHVNGYSYQGWYPDGAGFRDSNDGRWGGIEAQAVHDFAPWHRVVAGAAFTRNTRADYRAWDDDGVVFDSNRPYDVIALYVQDEVQLGSRVSLTGGLRYDGHSDSRDVVSPRFAVVASPSSRSSFKLLHGVAFRAPSVYELIYEADDFKRPLRLDPERIRTTELMWQQRLSHALFGLVSLYRYDLDDLIDTRIDPVDSLGVFDNRDRVTALGAEFELNGQLGSGLTGYASYGVQRAEDRASGTRLTNSPGHLAKVGLSSVLLDRVTASGELRYESGRTTVYDTRTEAVVLANVSLASPRLWRGLGAVLRVRNALNSSWATPGGFEHVQPAIAQDGRMLTLQLDYRFW